MLGGYQYLEYKGNATPSKLNKVTVLAPGGAAVKAAVDARRDDRRRGHVGARPGQPAVEGEAARRRGHRGARAAARHRRHRPGARRQAAADATLGGVLGVGQGSEQPPRFLKLTYAPSGARGKPLAFVGKGVVFDSGGLSLKTSGGMETMKTDMAGGAAVIAAMSTLSALGVKTRVTGYVPLVENMPSGNAIRPGDVLKIRNGKTVEVLNTDAEGRLILADALSLAIEDKPAAIIDLATLTGACMVALGDKIAGLMGNDDGWSDQVRAAADRAGEQVWPLPLPEGVPQAARVRGRRHEEHRRQLRRRAHRRACSCRSSSTACRGCTSTSPVPRVPTPTTATSRRAAPASACARWSSWRARSRLRSREPPGGARARRGGAHRARADHVGVATRPHRTPHRSAQVDDRAPTVHKTVTIHIRDNFFDPAATNIAAGTTVRWINDGRNTHNVTPATGKEYGSPDLKPGRSYVHTFDDDETVQVLLHAARHPHERPARRARGRRRRGRHAGADRGLQRRTRAVVLRFGPHHPGARRRQDHPGRRRQGEEGRPRAGVARRLQGERHHRHRRHRAARRRPQHARSSTASSSATTACSSSAATVSRSRTSPRATTPRTGSSGTACWATAARTSPCTATATTASTRTTRSTASSSTRTRRAAPTPGSTSGSATRATR